MPLVLVVVGGSLDRNVLGDPTHAPRRIVFGGVGVVGKAVCVRRSVGLVVIDGRAKVRGGDVTDQTVADVMVASGSGVDGIVDVEIEPVSLGS